jgi:hypothetical protein
MKLARNWAIGFAIANLVLGILTMLGPTVRTKPALKERVLGRDRNLINRDTGQLLGFMGAVNPPHSILHFVLGALGLGGAYLRRGLSRPYLGLLGLLYAAWAFMGWRRTGFKPGTDYTMGFAVDRTDNIIHTLIGAAGLGLAAYTQPSLEGKINDAAKGAKRSVKKVGVGG